MHTRTKRSNITCASNKTLLQVPELFGEQVVFDCEITELESDAGWEQWLAAALAQDIEVPSATSDGIAAPTLASDYVDPFASVGKKSA